MGYFAVLAYPDREEWSKRTEFVEAFKARVSKIYLARGGGRRKILPKYRGMKNERINGILSRAFYRIQALRLPAAEMANWRIMHGQRIGPIVIKFEPPKKEYWARKFAKSAVHLWSIAVSRPVENGGIEKCYTERREIVRFPFV